MKVTTCLGERAFVHILFQTYLATPSLEDALHMRKLREVLELNKLPEGNLRRDDLEGSDKEAVLESVSVQWLREKIRAAFAAQKITSTYSDFALSLLWELEPQPETTS